MPILHRLIFRLDFPLAYGFMDRRGEALKILMELRKDYWPNVGEGANHSLVGESLHDDKASFRNLTFDAQAVHGSFELRTGYDLARVEESNEFRAFDDYLRAYCEMFKIDTVNRCGVRVYLFDTVGDNFSNPFAGYLKLLNQELLKDIGAYLGEPTDIGTVIEGKDKDELKYRVKFGPFSPDDPKKIMRRVEWKKDEDRQKSSPESHLTFDIDFYENDFSFKGLGLRRWSRPIWPKSEKILNAVKLLLLDNHKQKLH